ncbi:MAG: hypothetical protein JEZ09_08980 [Salinivirgaceae bacterium]|nr:hypothetical protein [Salinivirgaceae bacterium]
MTISIQEVKTKKDLKHFIYLAAKIHKNHGNWIPPIYLDEWAFFSSKKNPLFAHCDTILLLAKKENEIVGRIMGIINHRYNQSHNENHGRFCFMETNNDKTVAEFLLKSIEIWSKEKGMEALVGPLAFSDKDPQGMMIEGFDQPLVIATNGNLPYQPKLIEDYGYSKHRDMFVYKIIIPETVPEFYQKIFERKINNGSVHVFEPQSKKQLRKYIIPVLTLLNETFKDIYAFTPMTPKEMKEFANRYIPILNPKFIKLVTNDVDEVIAFVIAMPDVSEGIKKSKGYLFPFGIFHLMNSQKHTKQLNLLLGGIREDYRNKGLDALMAIKMLEEAKHAKMEYIDSHLTLEVNTKIRAEMERLDGEIYKRYRVYIKRI